MNDYLACRCDALPVAMFSVGFDNVTKSDAIERIEHMIVSRQPHYVVTANVDFLAQARSDIELHRILLGADLVLCDGTPLVWASRVLGNPLPERVAGADIVPQLIRLAAKKNYRLFFLGAAPETVERAAERLRLQFPGLLIDCYSPSFGSVFEMDHDEIKRRILKLQPDLLFVALGCPKQEKWIAMHYRSLNVPVSIGVGGTVDFLAGKLRRAPVWMQRTGTEWIFRLTQEPRRLLGRYMTDLRVFAAMLPTQWWHLSFHPQSRSTTHSSIARSDISQDLQIVTLPSRWDLKSARENWAVVASVLGSQRNCILVASGVDFIDSTGIALLTKFQRMLGAANRQLILVAPSYALQRAMRLLRLDHYFLDVPDLTTARNLLGAITDCEPVIAPTSPTFGDASLEWRGEITAVNAATVCERTKAQMDSSPQRVVIDLSAVRFIDSSGIGVMVRMKKLAAERNRALSFVRASPTVRNVVRIARLEDFLLSDPVRLQPQTATYEPTGLAAT